MLKKRIEFFKQFLMESRWELLNKIIRDRTKYITVVLEDIYQSQNASAVLRTCDCFGIQDIHIIENENLFKVNPDVVLGSSKWLNLFLYNSQENNTLSTINQLKEKGYRIVATTPHINDVELDDFDYGKGKFALFFGSELPGLSKLVLDNADEFLKIPMVGFTESFNISVSAAIILHQLTYKLKKSDINWKLSETEKDEILYNWLKISFNDSDLIEKEFYKRNPLL
jgi:tRNA (guanosine-2'-O-)-methyltransferase